MSKGPPPRTGRIVGGGGAPIAWSVGAQAGADGEAREEDDASAGSFLFLASIAVIYTVVAAWGYVRIAQAALPPFSHQFALSGWFFSVGGAVRWGRAAERFRVPVGGPAERRRRRMFAGQLCAAAMLAHIALYFSVLATIGDAVGSDGPVMSAVWGVLGNFTVASMGLGLFATGFLSEAVRIQRGLPTGRLEGLNSLFAALYLFFGAPSVLSAMGASSATGL